MRGRHLTLVLGAGTLLIGALPSQIAHASGGPERYASPFGVDTGDCSDASNPCQTVQYAVNQSSDGDTINLARGAYVEQVEINVSVTIVGAGRDHTTIEAPPSLVANTQASADGGAGATYIVDIDNSGPSGEVPTVTVSNLTVAGPGPSQAGGASCAANASTVLATGIDVWGGATLHLTGSAVRNIYNRPNDIAGGCQTGEAVSIGSGCFSCSPDTGHAVLAKDLVSVYQKDGITVRGVGSTLSVSATSVVNNPNPVIASNGIEVLNGASATIKGAKVSGNECNLASVCGPAYTDAQASGILIFAAGLPTSVTKSTVTGNDVGLYDDTGIHATKDVFDNNRYFGLEEDVDAADGVFNSDTANSTTVGADQYGFYTLSPTTNNFQTDTATGNSAFDMYESSPTHDNNIYVANVCGTAFPSPAHWNC